MAAQTLTHPLTAESWHHGAHRWDAIVTLPPGTEVRKVERIDDGERVHWLLEASDDNWSTWQRHRAIDRPVVDGDLKFTEPTF